MEIPTITIEDDKYIYYPNGLIYLKRFHRWVGLMKGNHGYLTIGINGKMKLVHRVIYEKFNGEISDNLHVDHINNIRTDNRIQNLQLLTHIQNCQKQLIRSNNTSGYTGVFFRKDSNSWGVQIKQNNNKNIYYKSGFKTKEEAIIARNAFIDANPELCKYYIKS